MFFFNDQLNFYLTIGRFSNYRRKRYDKKKYIIIELIKVVLNLLVVVKDMDKSSTSGIV
ncbi:hypothetical protein [Clostridium butyricum]